jgi:hypothetical protein
MSILTGRELELLASLRMSWKTLYWSELARLLKEDDARQSRITRAEVRTSSRTGETPAGGDQRPQRAAEGAANSGCAMYPQPRVQM